MNKSIALKVLCAALFIVLIGWAPQSALASGAHGGGGGFHGGGGGGFHGGGNYGGGGGHYASAYRGGGYYGGGYHGGGYYPGHGGYYGHGGDHGATRATARAGATVGEWALLVSGSALVGDRIGAVIPTIMGTTRLLTIRTITHTTYPYPYHYAPAGDPPSNPAPPSQASNYAPDNPPRPAISGSRTTFELYPRIPALRPRTR